MFDRPVTFPTYMVSGSDRDDVRVAALTNPQSMPDQLETMLWRFLAGTTVPAPVPRPEPPTMEQMLQRLLVGTPAQQPVPAALAGNSDLETLLKTLLSRNLAPLPRP